MNDITQLKTKFLGKQFSCEKLKQEYSIPCTFFHDETKEYVTEKVKKQYEQLRIHPSCPLLSEIKTLFKETSFRLILPGFAYTMEYRPDRINFKVDDNGFVTNIYQG